jgi:hypothetical protein
VPTLADFASNAAKQEPMHPQADPCRWASCSLFTGKEALIRTRNTFKKLRMAMRRFTRLTNAFSQKFENHCHSLALYFFWYNWVCSHKTLGVTPAMAAGLVQTPLKFTDLLTAVDADEQNQIAEKRRAILEPSEQLSRPHSN